MFTFNLKKEWFEKFRKGEKDTEYRLCKDYWNKRIQNLKPGVTCVLRLGYTDRHLLANIEKISIMDKKDTDLKNDTSEYDKCWAIKLKDIRFDIPEPSKEEQDYNLYCNLTDMGIM